MVPSASSEDLRHRRDPDLELRRRRLLRRQQALDLAAGRVEGLGERVAVVAVAPGEHLDRQRSAGEADPGAGGGAGALDQPLEQDRAAGGEQHHRHDQVRAAAVVLLGDRSDVVDPLLVGGDRLMLDPVVGGEVAVAEGDDRGHRSQHLHQPLAQGGGRRPLAQDRGDAEGESGRGDDAAVLERKPGRRHPPPHQRQDQHRLGEFDRAAQPRQFRDQARRQLRLALGGDFDRAVAVADGGGPVGGAVDQQAVAERHAAEAESLGSHGLTIGDRVARPGNVMQRGRRAQSARRPRPPCAQDRPEAPSQGLQPGPSALPG